MCRVLAGTGVRVIIETGSAVAGAAVQTLEHPGISGSTTLRELFAVLVVEDVAGYEERRAARAITSLLNPTALAAGLHAGAVRNGARRLPAAPTLPDALARVVEGFRDGLVLAFLDGVPIQDLDTPLVVGASSRLRLVRLIALRGG